MGTERELRSQTRLAHPIAMTGKDFDKLSRLIHGHCGIRITAGEKVMVESRLSQRLRLLGLNSYRQYCDYLFSDRGMDEELVHMIDAITTNKTDFFREPAHFHYLTDMAVPELIRRASTGIARKLMLWSAGCSTGEEAYTLAMVLSELRTRYPGLDYLILATDISTRALQAAKTAIYDEEKIIPLPEHMKKKYLLRGRNDRSGQVRIVPELRASVIFRRLNLMETDFGMQEQMDIIFCRNVIIYFDKATQERLLRKFCLHLSPGGYIFLGHSETLNGMNIPLVSVAPTIYRKRA